ncbi:MAG: tyrosine-type recombinase/integrase [Candidatus Daviesbacteria bacterium]|nr:tyrosine-type recombinase/integrase [Candidatus Daviesbacteria bacterium]
MITLNDARQQFIGHLQGRGRSSSTILAYGKDVEQLVDFLKAQGLEDPKSVSTEDLRSFMKKLSKESYTAKSISRKTNSTKTFFKYLRISNLLEADPAVGLEHPDFENKPPRILTKLEYRALRDAARGDIRMSAIIELLLQTGIRIGELSKLQLEDLRLTTDNPAIYVHPEEGSVERTIPLNKPALESLQKYIEIRPKTQSNQIPRPTTKALFITKTGRPLLVRNIRTAIDRYFRLAGIVGAKVNDLRHTWVARQLQSGLSLVMVSKLSGHKRVSTTERYLQYVPARTSEDKVRLEEL